MNNRKGFTLVEVLMSIVVLAVICGTVLQLFLLSNNLERKAFHTEMAHIHAIKIIELAKAAPSPDQADFRTGFLFPLIRQKEEQLFVTAYFDEDWNQTAHSVSPGFSLSFHAIPEKENLPYGILYQLHVEIRSVDSPLISYSAKKYYGFPTGGGIP